MKLTEQIMALADAYASQLQVCNFDDADKARDALEAAVLAQGEQKPVAVFDEQLGRPCLVEGAPMLEHGQPLYTHPAPVAKQEPVATLWQHGETGRTRVIMPDTITDCDARWQLVGPLFLNPAPEAKQEPHIDHPMRHYDRTCPACNPEAKQEPVAQGEPCGWFDPQTGDYSRVNRLGWSALYLHPAPVNQPEPCCGEFKTCMKACTPRGKALVNQQLLEALKQVTDRFEQSGAYDHDHTVALARAAIAAVEGKV